MCSREPIPGKSKLCRSLVRLAGCAGTRDASGRMSAVLVLSPAPLGVELWGGDQQAVVEFMMWAHLLGGVNCSVVGLVSSVVNIYIGLNEG